MSKPQTWLSPAIHIALFALLMLLTSLYACPITHAKSIFIPAPWYTTSIDTNTADLIDNCPQPFENFSEKCESAIDDYFADIPLEYPNTAWIAFPNRLTYGRAFKNPTEDRNRIVQALQERQCRLEDGETVRWDLSESCHADAFANFSVFLWLCSEYGHPTNPSDYVVDMSKHADLEYSRPEQYNRILHNRIVQILEKHWFSSQCSKYDLTEMRFDALQDPEQHKLLRSAAKRLGEDWRPPEVPETFVLKSLAARLGDSSTSMLYFGSSTRDDSWSKNMDKAWPWRHTIYLLGGGTFEEAIYGPFDRGKRLQMGISVAVSLQESELEFDWNHLVRLVCAQKNTAKNPGRAACQTAIEDLELSLEWDEKSELEALKKFESVARELGLYD